MRERLLLKLIEVISVVLIVFGSVGLVFYMLILTFKLMGLFY